MLQIDEWRVSIIIGKTTMAFIIGFASIKSEHYRPAFPIHMPIPTDAFLSNEQMNISLSRALGSRMDCSFRMDDMFGTLGG